MEVSTHFGQGIRTFWAQKIRQEKIRIKFIKLIKFIKIVELHQVFLCQNASVLPYCIQVSY